MNADRGRTDKFHLFSLFEVLIVFQGLTFVTYTITSQFKLAFLEKVLIIKPSVNIII